MLPTECLGAHKILHRTRLGASYTSQYFLIDSLSIIAIQIRLDAAVKDAAVKDAAVKDAAVMVVKMLEK